MARGLLDKTICPACLALQDEAGDLGSSPSQAINFLLYVHVCVFALLLCGETTTFAEAAVPTCAHRYTAGTICIQILSPHQDVPK